MGRNKLPNQTSIESGLLLREARKKRNVTLKTLGEMLGLSFQQLQKYESGANELSTDWQQKIIKILTLPLDYFQLGRNTSDFQYQAEKRDFILGLSDSSSEQREQSSENQMLELFKIYTSLDENEDRQNLLEYARYLQIRKKVKAEA